MADFPLYTYKGINGVRMPFTEPQHFTGNGDEVVRTGNDNPLPTANYTQNSNGIWMPVSEDNPMPTQLTGSKVEVIKKYLKIEDMQGLDLNQALHVGNGITTYQGGTAFSPLLVSVYRDKSILIVNNHDVAISVEIRGYDYGNVVRPLSTDDTALFRSEPITVSSGANKFLNYKETSDLSNLTLGMTVVIRPAAKTETGNIRILFLGGA